MRTVITSVKVITFASILCGLIIQCCPAHAQQPAPRPSVREFLDAISSKQTNAAATMLENNTNLARGVWNMSKLPVLEAAAAGNITLVKRLIELGADINARGDTLLSAGSSATALYAAIQHDQPAMCQWLLNAGADPSVMGFGFTTPLYLAVARGRDDMAGWLLDYGANPFQEKAYANNKSTPFDAAITNGTGKLVPRMLGQEPQNPLGTKAQSVKPVSPVDLEKGRSKILADRGGVLLGAAAQRAEMEAVQALIKAGVRADGTNAQGEPILRAFALSAARAAGSTPPGSEQWQGIRDLLVHDGAEYDAFAATAMGDMDRVRQLLSADKTVAQARDRTGQTLLHWSVRSDQPAMTTFWVDAGVPLGATNDAGITALHLAASKGLDEHIKILLAAHAPAGVRDTNGWTPLDAAIQAKQPNTIRLLLSDKSAETRTDRGISTPLHQAAADGRLAMLVMLMENATNLETRDELGLTPLQVAVMHGHLAAAAMLLDKGADVNVRDPNGNTLLLQIYSLDRPLMVSDRPPALWLSRLGSDPRKDTYLKYLSFDPGTQGPSSTLQATAFLLATGVDPKTTNRAGQTAIQLATDEKAAPGLLLFDDDRAALLQLLGTGGANLNVADADGNTALHRNASGYDGLLGDKIKELLASGADINATNKRGRTALHVAVEKLVSSPEPGYRNNALLELLQNKPNVNAQDNDGLTPLHVLAAADSSFRPQATKALLDAGANPNLRDHLGRTPIHLFLSGKWPWSDAGECIQLLVGAGGDLSAKDADGKTPLHYLAGLGSQNPTFFIHNIGNMLLTAKVDILARDNEGNTPLHIAARTGTQDVFAWLVKQGAGLDETNRNGETPRLLAAHSTNRPAGMPPNAQTDVTQAVREGNVAAVTALLKADPGLLNQTNRFGQTPLRVAALAHRTNLIEMLDQKGAHWDVVSAVIAGPPAKLREIMAADTSAATNTLNRTSLLHLAAARDDADIVEILLESHCSLDASDPHGLSPLGLALLQHRRTAADLLRQRGATCNIFDAVWCGDSATSQALLSKDPPLVAATNAMGMNLVDIAAATDHADILAILLDKGGSATTGDLVARTPLHLAAIYNCTNSAAVLLQRGAAVGAQDRYGLSPLHLAAIRGSVQVVDLLLQNKADPNLANAHLREAPMSPIGMTHSMSECTPLHLAAMTGQSNVIELLIKAGADVNKRNAGGETALDSTSGPAIPPNLLSLLTTLTSMTDTIYGGSSTQTNGLTTLAAGRKAAANLLEKNGGQHGRPQAMVVPRP